MTDYTPHLEEAIERLTGLIQLLRPVVDVPRERNGSSSSTKLSSSRLFAYHPPIIDTRTGPWVSDEPLGLKKYVDSLETHLALLQAVRDLHHGSQLALTRAHAHRRANRAWHPTKIHYQTSLDQSRSRSRC